MQSATLGVCNDPTRTGPERLFPLVVAGAILGKICAVAVGDPNAALFPLIAVAAFLGAGYRTPLAGVVFVAEATGRAGFVVPGVIASVAAQLMMGGKSVSLYQHRADQPTPDATHHDPRPPSE